MTRRLQHCPQHAQARVSLGEGDVSSLDLDLRPVDLEAKLQVKKLTVSM